MELHTYLCIDDRLKQFLKTEKAFPIASWNLLELLSNSSDDTHCSMPEPLAIVMEMLMLICGADFPWYSSESNSPPYPF